MTSDVEECIVKYQIEYRTLWASLTLALVARIGHSAHIMVMSCNGLCVLCKLCYRVYTYIHICERLYMVFMYQLCVISRVLSMMMAAGARSRSGVGTLTYSSARAVRYWNQRGTNCSYTTFIIISYLKAIMTLWCWISNQAITVFIKYSTMQKWLPMRNLQPLEVFTVMLTWKRLGNYINTGRSRHITGCTYYSQPSKV